MGEILLKKFIEKLVDVGFDYLKDLHGCRTGMEAELQRLTDALPRIQAVVNAAEAEPELLRRNPNLRAWLWQLKDAAYEADDVLDELDYLRLQKQVEEANAKDQERQNLKVRASNSLTRAIKRLRKSYPTLDRKSDHTLENLRVVVEKMDGIAAHVGDFLAIFNTVQQQNQLHQAQVVNDRETGPLLPGGSSVVIGRDTEREELVQWLMKPSDEDGENSVPLLSVVGAGGMGKTTLSQFVFNDERVQKFFDLKIWVCVSTNFDTSRLLAAVIESATNKKPEVESLAPLQTSLKELVSSGKFLLVLDDAWNDDNRPGWDNLLAPLKCGKKGSKILLTTRSDRVAEMAAQAATWGKKDVMKLAGLEDHVFISLFYQYAFAGLKSDDYPKLQSIGKKIARRLGGSPLAAKSIGALLNSKLDDQHWEIILHNNILDAQQADQDNINSILMLSYLHLPAHLRSCFAYCSIFPQDYEIDKMILIRMWVGVGLIQRSPQNQSQTDEDIGGYYFDGLLKRSFFEPHPYDKGSYAMHDLLHELAQSVSQDECFRAVDDTSIQGIPTMVRHLWIEIDNPNLLKKVDKWKDLRTLVLISKEYDHHEHSKIFSEVLGSLKSIRVLVLNVEDMEKLPDEIGYLIHLRVLSMFPLRTYVRLSSNISRLPSLICKLYHLQFLELYRWGRLDSECIPQGMNNLISLKGMTPVGILDKIDGIGKLISLHELVFSIEEKSGRRIEELKDLNNLRTLQIKGLENIKSYKEASMAELHNKGQLLKLELEWGPGGSPDELVEHEEILDCLRPHSNLKELSIRGYRGVRHAKWMEYESINNLEKIVLSDLHRLECLPCLGKLPYLKFLWLQRIPKVKQLDCEGGFPQLKRLLILSLDELEEWSGLVENLSQWCPHLQELYISGCPRLKVLPSLPLGLAKLELYNVGLTTLPSFWPASNNEGSCSSSTESSSSSLSTVTIINCEQLTSLARGLLQHHLPVLQRLSIRNCNKLVDLPTEGLQHLSSLKALSIHACEELTSLGSLMALHLDYLSVSKCPKLVEATTAPSITGDSFTLTTDRLFVDDVGKREDIVEEVDEGRTAAKTDDPLLLLTEPLRNLTSVRNLKIRDCSRLDTPASWRDGGMVVAKQRIVGMCESAQGSLPVLASENSGSSSLKSLWLGGIDKLPSLPQLPSSMEYLVIQGCNNTLKKRCLKEDGADWPNIKHIPRIYIMSSERVSMKCLERRHVQVVDEETGN